MLADQTTKLWSYRPNGSTKTIKEVCEVDINDANINLMVHKSEGNMRNLIKIINHAEIIQNNDELTALLGAEA